MALKIYNKNTGELEPFSIEQRKEIISPEDGSIVSKQVFYNSFQDSLQSKVNTSGSVMNGSLEFLHNNGISGINVDGTNRNKSKIQFVHNSSNNQTDYFQVTNSIKDVENQSNEEVTKTFNLVCDSVPTENSKNLITSGDIYNYLHSQEFIDFIIQQMH